MDNRFKKIKDILKKESLAIIEAGKNLDESQIKKLIEKIVKCEGNLFFTGCGTSGFAAKKIVHTFCCLGIPSFFLDPSNSVHGGLGAINNNDLVILFSKGGRTVEINQMISPISKIGAYIVGVTENPKSELACSANLHIMIKIMKEADEFNMLATSSIVSLIAVFDAIAIVVSELIGFTKEKFGLIHPGGAVGERFKRERIEI